MPRQTKRNHTTPAHLLKQWTIGAGKRRHIWVRDKRNLRKAPYRSTPSNAGVRKNWYTQDVEDVMASIEGPASILLKRIREGARGSEWDDAARMLLAHYAEMFAWQRDPAVRKRLTETYDAEKLIQDEIADHAEGSERRKVLQQHKADVIKRNQDPARVLQSTWSASPYIRTLFFEMGCYVLRPDRGSFILPDRVLFFEDGMGAAKPNFQAFMPIGKRSCLLFHWGSEKHRLPVVRVGPEIVDYVNALAFKSSSEHTYAAGPNALRACLLMPPHPPSLQPYLHSIPPEIKPNSFKRHLSFLRRLMNECDDKHGRICCHPNAPIPQLKHNESYGVPLREHQWVSPRRTRWVQESEETCLKDHCKHCGMGRETFDDGHVSYVPREMQNGRNHAKNPEVGNWWQFWEVANDGPT